MNLPTFDDVMRWLPALAGSFVTAALSKEPRRRRLLMWFAGFCLSLFGGADAVRLSGLNAGCTGFLLGLFGMSMISSVLRGWERFEMSAILEDAARQLLRLPPKNRKEGSE